jgi:hypothetical protein
VTKRQETLNPTMPVFTSFMAQAVHLHQACPERQQRARNSPPVSVSLSSGPHRRLTPPARPPKRRISFSSCAASEGSKALPQPHVNDQSAFRSSSQSGHMRTAYRSQGTLRTLPLERPRGGSQEKTAASSVSERNEIADSEYCRSLQSPRKTRTRFHSGKTASKMVEGHREQRPQPRSVNVGMIQGDCLSSSDGRAGVCEK